jgi:hypothetical protein
MRNPLLRKSPYGHSIAGGTAYRGGEENTETLLITLFEPLPPTVSQKKRLFICSFRLFRTKEKS